MCVVQKLKILPNESLISFAHRVEDNFRHSNPSSSLTAPPSTDMSNEITSSRLSLKSTTTPGVKQDGTEDGDGEKTGMESIVAIVGKEMKKKDKRSSKKKLTPAEREDLATRREIEELERSQDFQMKGWRRGDKSKLLSTTPSASTKSTTSKPLINKKIPILKNDTSPAKSSPTQIKEFSKPSLPKFNDVVMAPPHLPKLKSSKTNQKVHKTIKSSLQHDDGDDDDGLGIRKETIMEQERERVINAYRELKRVKESQ